MLTDGSENVIDEFLYDAFGNVIARNGSTPTPFQWGGANPLVAADPTGLRVKPSGSTEEERKAQKDAYNQAKAYIIDYGKDKEATAKFALIESENTPEVTLNIGTNVAKDSTLATLIDGKAKNGGAIDWNPQLALTTVARDADTGAEKITGSQSPALGLYHEVCRMYDNLKSTRASGPVTQYDTKEERRVITGPEHRAATRLWETPRYNHAGRTFYVFSPLARR